MTSFRTRIRWVALGVFALLLVIFSLAVYLGLSQVLAHHIDESLLTVVRAEAAHIEDGVAQIEEFMEAKGASGSYEEHESHEEAYMRHELQEAVRESVILAPNRAILWRGDAIQTVTPLPDYLWSRVVNGEPVFDTLYPPQGSPLRRVSFPIKAGGETRYIVQTHLSLQFLEETQQGLMLTLGGLAGVILFLAWAGSTWIAREALLPVKSLSDTAANVSERTLGARVRLDAPYVEFQQLAQSFNGMMDRLQTVFESQRRFVADAAHELKTPLTAIKGHLEVALHRARTVDEYRETIGTTLGEVERLATLVRSLLMLAQYAGERPVHRQLLNLRSLLEQLTTDVSVLADERGCQLMAHLQGSPCIEGDAGQITQLMINLLDNAIKYTPRGGMIVVRLCSDSNMVRVDIADTGPGIPTECLPRLFDRFYRMDASRDRHSGGAGLGLAIAKEIVDAHGGTIAVRSMVGQGTTFTITFPAVQNATTYHRQPEGR